MQNDNTAMNTDHSVLVSGMDDQARINKESSPLGVGQSIYAGAPVG